jgi:hypothetical protein
LSQADAFRVIAASIYPEAERITGVPLLSFFISPLSSFVEIFVERQ